MRDFQRKRNIRKVLYSKGTLLLLLFLLVLVGKATWGLYAKEHESRKNLDRVEAELLNLNLREDRLRADIARLETPEGIETEIREQFQVARPGERMVVLVNNKKSEPEQNIKKQSLVSRFFNLFR